MSWQDDLGLIRELGPDEPLFNAAVKRVWDHIEEAGMARKLRQIVEDDRSNWQKSEECLMQLSDTMMPTSYAQNLRTAAVVFAIFAHIDSTRELWERELWEKGS